MAFQLSPGVNVSEVDLTTANSFLPLLPTYQYLTASQGFVIELNATDRLEFPIYQNKQVLVNDEFLKAVVKEANRKLEISWKNICEFENQLNKCLNRQA